jgi:alpha-L-rhamnosidase
MSIALFRGIVAEDKVQEVADNLAQTIIENNSKMDVGLIGAKAILNVLSQNGYADLAFKIASSDEYPSWGYWIADGGTTLYETWEINAERDLSLNHIGFGEIGAWFYKALGGINVDETNPGFKNIKLQPHFPKGLDDIKVTHKGPYGNIVSAWKKEDNAVYYSAVVPPNSTAELLFDASVKQVTEKNQSEVLDLSLPIKLAAGKHEFVVK